MKSEIISVLIPTYNAEEYIVSLIRKLENQELHENQELEIIIVDSSSKDNTVSITRNLFSKVKIEVIENASFDHGGTRNKLADMANGDYLLFMTQDAQPYDNYLIQKLHSSFKNEKVAVSYARQIPYESADDLEKFARMFNYPTNSLLKDKIQINNLGIKAFFNSNVCSMYDKNKFYKLEKFPEKLILNEDMVFSSKAILNDYSVYYNADAVVYHSHNYTLLQQFKRYFDIGMAFKETSYLLEYASNEKEGLRMVKKQLSFLITNKKKRLIPYALIQNIVKFISYNLGKKHDHIPRSVKRTISAYLK